MSLSHTFNVNCKDVPDTGNQNSDSVPTRRRERRRQVQDCPRDVSPFVRTVSSGSLVTSVKSPIGGPLFGRRNSSGDSRRNSYLLPGYKTVRHDVNDTEPNFQTNRSGLGSSGQEV